MPKPLRLDKDRKLALPEREVERTIREFLEVEGWQFVSTKAEARMPNGAAAHAQYTLDAVAVRHDAECFCAMSCQCSPAKSITLFLEFKRRNARTCKARLKGQTANVESLRQLGFVVYQAAEKDGDPIGSFKRFYEETFA